MVGKESFNNTFVNKETGRFIFKEIESEYNDNENSVESELEYPKEISHINKTQSAGQPLRSSLTQLEKANTSKLGLLYEGHCFRKNENRRSLLLESSINAIQEEAQSSQRERTEDQSVSQSNKEVEGSINQDEKKKNFTEIQKVNSEISPKTKGDKKQQNQLSASNKNFLTMLKNRKLSYLTQPLSI